ncbi:hypothetical protein HPB49_009547 [Dermacentor silvarum]|uniref:Uncharacterized protein n=1 Tax=Dermacentor silvarum TaxID=543639 RepID=A0ACB8CQZ7_DERSI|nr:hypothetical protein HPB49_009547 [Dermacentor silvarum]
MTTKKCLEWFSRTWDPDTDEVRHLLVIDQAPIHKMKAVVDTEAPSLAGHSCDKRESENNKKELPPTKRRAREARKSTRAWKCGASSKANKPQKRSQERERGGISTRPTSSEVHYEQSSLPRSACFARRRARIAHREQGEKPREEENRKTRQKKRSDSVYVSVWTLSTTRGPRDHRGHRTAASHPSLPHCLCCLDSDRL